MGKTIEQIHLIVRGRVQGVYFRDYTRRRANQLNLLGWVRNLPDRSVEILAQGEPHEIQALADWCWQGSPQSQVESVEQLSRCCDFDELFTLFSIRY